MTSVEAIQDEHRKIHRVQRLVDFAMHVLAHGELTRADAERLVTQVRTRVLQLFPDRADTFDVLYGRRFEALVATCPEVVVGGGGVLAAVRHRHIH